MSLKFPSLKILHCADLHLDAALSGSLRTSQNAYIDDRDIAILRDAPLLALNNISKTAINEKVDILIIAGDLFNMKDDAAMNHRVRSYLFNFFKILELENIQVVITVGNHDPLKFISEISASWPKNVFLFSNKEVETVSFIFNGHSVDIHGVSYATQNEDRNLAKQFPTKTNADFNIAVLHTNVGGDLNHSNYAPSSLKTLTSYDYDYFALGHIHKRAILSDNPLVAYSGNHQAFSPKPSECEAKGVSIIEFEHPGSIAISIFIETDVVRYIKEDLTIENSNSVEEIAENIKLQLENKYEDISQLILCRLVLTLIEFEGSYIDTDDLTDIINENITGVIITEIKTNSQTESFEELVQNSEYFQSIEQEIDSIGNIEIDELYGKQALKISNALSISEINVSDYVPIDTEIEVKEYISQVHNELLGKTK